MIFLKKTNLWLYYCFEDGSGFYYGGAYIDGLKIADEYFEITERELVLNQDYQIIFCGKTEIHGEWGLNAMQFKGKLDLECAVCGSRNLILNDFSQSYLCKECSYDSLIEDFTEEEPEIYYNEDKGDKLIKAIMS